MTAETAFWDRGRTFLESRMTDSCRITRPGSGDRVLDDDSLAYTDPDPVVVYQGKCRIPRTGGAHSAVKADAGEAAFEVDEFPLALPVTGAGYTVDEEVTVGCTVEYLTSARDQDLVGRTYGITGLNHQTDATERRFRMKEVVGT